MPLDDASDSLHIFANWIEASANIEQGRHFLGKHPELLDGKTLADLKERLKGTQEQLSRRQATLALGTAVFIRYMYLGLEALSAAEPIAVQSVEQAIEAVYTFIYAHNPMNLFLDWLKLDGKSPTEGRHFLEGTPAMLDPANDVMFVKKIALTRNEEKEKGQSEESIEQFSAYLETQLMILREVRKYLLASWGSVTECIDAAYVNVKGGLILDLPSWLEEIKTQLYLLMQGGSLTAKGRIDLLRKTIERVQHEQNISPLVLADLSVHLGNAYMEDVSADPAVVQEAALAAYLKAFQVDTLTSYPIQHAVVHDKLCQLYWQRFTGDKRTNLEQALMHGMSALSVYTREEFPRQWAATQCHMGYIYLTRLDGGKRQNVEEAIQCLTAATQIITAESELVEWVKIQAALSAAYLERLHGNAQTNIEQALACAWQALKSLQPQMEKALADTTHIEQYFTANPLPQTWAILWINMGNAFSKRSSDRRQSLEEALLSYKSAQDVFRREWFPLQWAKAEMDIAATYFERIEGEKQANLEFAVRHWRALLQLYTRDAYPIDYRRVQRLIAKAEVERQNWEAALNALEEAAATEPILLRLGAGAFGRDASLKEGYGTAMMHGFVLTRLGQIEQAAVVLERGQAWDVSEALAVDVADEGLIKDEQRRMRYLAVRESFRKTQRVLNTMKTRDLPQDTEKYQDVGDKLAAIAEYHQAQDELERIIAEIRTAKDPEDFLLDTLDSKMILQAASSGRAGHALVYLAEKIAVAVLSPQQSQSPHDCFIFLDLPDLTFTFLDDLGEPSLTSGKIIGGLTRAQRCEGLRLVLYQYW